MTSSFIVDAGGFSSVPPIRSPLSHDDGDAHDEDRSDDQKQLHLPHPSVHSASSPAPIVE
jgi:hypothetical protein